MTIFRNERSGGYKLFGGLEGATARMHTEAAGGIFSRREVGKAN